MADSPTSGSWNSLTEMSHAIHEHNYEEQISHFPAIYAEVLSLCQVLYATIGYQPSVGLGGQHRQRGAFADLAWCDLSGIADPRRQSLLLSSFFLEIKEFSAANSSSAVVVQEEEAIRLTCVDSIVSYLNVGEVFSDFILAKSKDPFRSPVEIMFPKESTSNIPRIRPIFFVPTHYNTTTTSSTGEKETGGLSHDIRNALVDQFYHSQVYETVASDHDFIGSELIPRLPRSCFRWSTTYILYNYLWFFFFITRRYCHRIEPPPPSPHIFLYV